MPDILISMRPPIPGQARNNILYSGEVYAGQDETIGPIYWSVEVPRRSDRAEVHAAILGAVNAATAAYGIAPATALDRKVVTGGVDSLG